MWKQKTLDKKLQCSLLQKKEKEKKILRFFCYLNFMPKVVIFSAIKTNLSLQLASKRRLHMHFSFLPCPSTVGLNDFEQSANVDDE